MALPQVYPAPPYPGAVAIYSLIDPRNGETRYVGKTISPKQRYRDHLQSPKEHPHTYCARWIATVLEDGLRPILRVLDWVGPEVWEQAEAHYIVIARAAGARLTNATDGGDGHAGLRPSAEGRKKLSVAQRKRWASVSPEQKTRITAAMHAGGVPDHVRAFRSEMMTRIWAERKAAGLPMPTPPPSGMTPALKKRDPDAFRAMRSEAARKAYATRRRQGTAPAVREPKPAREPKRARAPRPTERKRAHAPFGSAEHTAKLSAAHKGKTLSPEHRAKIGAAHKGRHFSDESRAKMSASRKGRVTSAETRAKMSASHKAFFERRKAARSVGDAHVPNSPASVAPEAYEQLRLPGT